MDENTPRSVRAIASRRSSSVSAVQSLGSENNAFSKKLSPLVNKVTCGEITVIVDDAAASRITLMVDDPAHLDLAIEIVSDQHLENVAREGGDVVDALRAIWPALTTLPTRR